MTTKAPRTPLISRQHLNNSHVCHSTVRERDGKVVHYGVVSKREYFYQKQLMEERQARTKYISSDRRRKSQFTPDDKEPEELRATKIYHAAGESADKAVNAVNENATVSIAATTTYSKRRPQRGGVIRFGRKLVVTSYEEEIEKITYIQLWWRSYLLIKRQREEERMRLIEMNKEQSKEENVNVNIEVSPEIKKNVVLKTASQLSPKDETISLKHSYIHLQPQKAYDDEYVISHQHQHQHPKHNNNNIQLTQTPIISETLSSTKPKVNSNLIQPQSIDFDISSHPTKLYYKDKMLPIWKEESIINPQDEQTSQVKFFKAIPPKKTTSYTSLTTEDIHNEHLYKGISSYDKWNAHNIPKNESQKTLTYANKTFNHARLDNTPTHRDVHVRGNGSVDYYKGKIIPIWNREMSVEHDKKKKISVQLNITRDYYKDKVKRIWKEENEIQPSSVISFSGCSKPKTFERLETDEIKGQEIKGIPAYKKWNRDNSSHKLFEDTVVSENKSFNVKKIKPTKKGEVSIDAKKVYNLKTFKVVDNGGVEVEGKKKGFEGLEEGNGVKEEIEGEPVYKRWNKRNESMNAVENTVEQNIKRFNVNDIEPIEKDGLTITSYNKTFGPVDVEDNTKISVNAQPKRFGSLERNGQCEQQIEGEPVYKKWNKRNTSANAHGTTLTSENKSFNVSGLKPTEKDELTLTSENKTFNIKAIRPTEKDALTITSENKTFGPVGVIDNGELSVKGQPKRFNNIQREEGISNVIEGVPIHHKWNKRNTSASQIDGTVTSKNKRFNEEHINPTDKDRLTITSHNKTFDPVEVQQGNKPLTVRGIPKPKRFDRIEPNDNITEEIEGEPAYQKWNKRNTSTNPVDEVVVSENKSFNIKAIKPSAKESNTITSHHKTFDPVNIQENETISVGAIPRRFKNVEQEEAESNELHGENVLSKWNKRNRSTNPYEETVVSKNKKFDESEINPTDKGGLTITSTHKTFGPVDVQENETLAVQGQPRKFKNIKQGENVIQEIEGEPISQKWNKQNKSQIPYDNTVISKNKNFDKEGILPTDKNQLSITSTHKTFGPINVQENETLAVQGQPRRFRELLENHVVSKGEVEGESIPKRWNKNNIQDTSAEHTLVSENKSFNIKAIKPSVKESNTITSHHKTFDPVGIQENESMSVRGQPKRFKNVERSESINKEIEGEPAYQKWNKRNTSTTPVEKTVVSENRKFKENGIIPTEKDGLTITSTHKTFGPVDIQENETLAVQGQPKRFNNIQREEGISNELHGENVLAKWNKRNRSTNPYEETVVSKNKKFDESEINPTDKGGLTITSTHKTFGPVDVQENETLAVQGQPRRFNNIEQEEGMNEQIEGEPAYHKWNKQNISQSPYDDTVISKNKQFDNEVIKPTDKNQLSITSTHKTFGPINVQDNEQLSVDAQPRRFKQLEQNEEMNQQIQGEPSYHRWNKRNRSTTPVDETVISENKKFNIKALKPYAKESATITSHHKSFDPISIQENEPLAVQGQPKRFNNIKQTDGLSTELHGETILSKWNKRNTSTTPIDETVISENKKFNSTSITPSQKDNLTLTSTHKTFGPTNIQENSSLSISSHPYRFKNIQLTSNPSTEIEGESVLSKWNNRNRSTTPHSHSLISENKRFNTTVIEPTSKDNVTLTSHHKTFDTPIIQGSTPLTVRAIPKPKRFDRIEPHEHQITEVIEGEPSHSKWNRRNKSANAYDETITSSNKHFDTTSLKPFNKDEVTLTSHIKAFDVIDIQENASAISVKAGAKRFNKMETVDEHNEQIVGEPTYKKWNQHNTSSIPYDETLISTNKQFTLTSITPTNKDEVTLISHIKSFDPVNIDNTNTTDIYVQSQPKRFRELSKSKISKGEIEGEPIMKRWNRHNVSSNAMEGNVVSKHKMFDMNEITPVDNEEGYTVVSNMKAFTIEAIKPVESECVTLTYKNKNFEQCNIEPGNNEQHVFDRMHKRFDLNEVVPKDNEECTIVSNVKCFGKVGVVKAEEVGVEGVKKGFVGLEESRNGVEERIEFEGDTTYKERNVMNTRAVPKDLKRMVTSENKMFNVSELEQSKNNNAFTISSYNKTFGPVDVEDNTKISVNAQPKRFGSLERNGQCEQQIEGEPAYKKWNKRNTSANAHGATLTSENKSFNVSGLKPTEKDELTLTSENKTFNIKAIRPTEKDALTITSENKTFGPVGVTDNGELSVQGQPKRFNNIQREEGISNVIEGVPIHHKWNKRNTSANQIDGTVTSKNKRFNEEYINPTDKDRLTITSHNKTFDPVEVQQGNKPLTVRGIPKPKRFDVLEPKEVVTKGEIEGEPIPVRWNRDNISEIALGNTLISENKSFNIMRMQPTNEDTNTITSTHKTFGPVDIQENETLAVQGQPKRFNNIQREEGISNELHGENVLSKWNNRNRSTNPYEETVVSKNKKFDESEINPTDKGGLTITSTHKTFGPVDVQENETLAVQGQPRRFNNIEQEEGMNEQIQGEPAYHKWNKQNINSSQIDGTVISKNKRFDEAKINPVEKGQLSITSTHKTFGPIDVQENETLAVQGQPRRFKQLEQNEEMNQQIQGEPSYHKWNKRNRSTTPVKQTLISEIKSFNVKVMKPSETSSGTIGIKRQKPEPNIESNNSLSINGQPRRFNNIKQGNTVTKVIEGEPIYQKWNQRNTSANQIDGTVVSKNKRFDEDQINPIEKDGLTITSMNKTFGPVNVQETETIVVKGVAKPKRFDVLEPKEVVTKGEIEGEPIPVRWNRDNISETALGNTLVSENKSFNIMRIQPTNEDTNTIISMNKTFGPVNVQENETVSVRGIPKPKRFDRIEPNEILNNEIEGEPIHKKWNKQNISNTPIEETVVSKNKKFDEEQINPTSNLPDNDGLTIISHHKTFDPIEIQGHKPLSVRGIPKPKRFDRIEPNDNITEVIEGEPSCHKWNKRNRSTTPVDETVVSKNKRFDEEQINPINKDELTITSMGKTFGPVEIQQGNLPIAVRGVPKPKQFETIEPEDTVAEEIEGEPAYHKWNKRNTSTDPYEHTLVSENKSFNINAIKPINEDGDTLTFRNKMFDPVEVQGSQTTVAVKGVPKPKRFDNVEPNEGVNEEIEGFPAYLKWNNRNMSEQPVEETVVSKNKRFNEEYINPVNDVLDDNNGLTITSHHKTFDPVNIQENENIAVKGIPKAKRFDRIEPEDNIVEKIEGEPSYHKWNKRNKSTTPVDETVISKNKRFDEEQINPIEKDGLTITSMNKTFGQVNVQETEAIVVKGVAKPKRFDVLEPKEVVTKGEIEGEPIPVRWNRDNISETALGNTLVSENKSFNIMRIQPTSEDTNTIINFQQSHEQIHLQDDENLPKAVRSAPKPKRFDRTEPNDVITEEIKGEPTYQKWNKQNISNTPIEETVVSKNKKFDEENLHDCPQTSTKYTLTKPIKPLQPETTHTCEIAGVPTSNKWNIDNLPQTSTQEFISHRIKPTPNFNIETSEAIQVSATSKLKPKQFSHLEPFEQESQHIEGEPISKRWNNKNTYENIEPSTTLISEMKRFKEDAITQEDNNALTVEGNKKQMIFETETIDHNVNGNTTKQYYKDKIKPIWQEESQVNTQQEDNNKVRYVRASALPQREEMKLFTTLQEETASNTEYKGTSTYEKWNKEMQPNTAIKNATVVSNHKQFDNVIISNPNSVVNVDANVSNRYYKDKVGPIWSNENEIKNNEDVDVRGKPTQKVFSKLEKSKTTTAGVNAIARKGSNPLWKNSLSQERRINETLEPKRSKHIVEESGEIIYDDAEKFEVPDDDKNIEKEDKMRQIIVNYKRITAKEEKKETNDDDNDEYNVLDDITVVKKNSNKYNKVFKELKAKTINSNNQHIPDCGIVQADEPHNNKPKLSKQNPLNIKGRRTEALPPSGANIDNNVYKGRDTTTTKIYNPYYNKNQNDNNINEYKKMLNTLYGKNKSKNEEYYRDLKDDLYEK